jgi:hypothetical protein
VLRQRQTNEHNIGYLTVTIGISVEAHWYSKASGGVMTCGVIKAEFNPSR